VAKTLSDVLQERPGDAQVRAAHKAKMLAQVQAYRLRELRQALALTQTDVAASLDVSQKRISELERGDVDRTRVDTLRRYARALGGTLRVEIEIGTDTYQIA
jgi:predicted transcriptional regulator